ncbi:LysR substrate-binding domain-containing protein [Lysobacter sp. Root494]|uniref:LysR substrate-binding domain-containing protein n=1 Tax=Lysobacter sp. Root494 TaxID=1736549 RepID=UPI0006F26F56|nr:LysR substrate-binding domain-containing protein [Lysobacter sp. Root494]KQY52625.1 transcriptional regulator [Lysobacter sp. Root494]
MDREILLHLPVVIAVARHRNFAAAAAELGLSPSSVSHSVRLVEQRLRGPLFARTTRSVSLTEAGEAFVRQAGGALEQLRDATEQVRSLQGRVSGLLRINAPRVSLPMVMTQLLIELNARHPELEVEVTSDDALVDIVAQGYDCGVRLGEMIAEDMVATRLTLPFKAIMVASPAYLALHGVPESLDAMFWHRCIGYRLISSGSLYAWDVQYAGRDMQLEVTGPARVTDPLFALELALAGLGIAYVFEPLAREAIRDGRLQWLLPDTAIDEPGLFAYYPRRASEVPKMRAFIAAARDLVGMQGG